MLYGIDISHHNPNLCNEKTLTPFPFAFHKATEGKSYLDPQLGHFLTETAHIPIVPGFYHFCRADNGNTPYSEAHHFLDMIPHYDMMLLALDIEAKSLSVPNIDNWARTWMDEVYYQTGIRPLLYCSMSQVKKFKSVHAGNYGLWVARYGTKPLKKDIRPWSFWAFWQFTSRPFDKDYFNGSLVQLKKYATPER